MSCIYPSKIVNPRYRKYPFYLDDKPFPPDYYISIPCGQCSECKRSRANEWKFRLEIERQHSTNALFVTLTYDNYHYALFRNDIRLSIRRFLERYRKKYKVSIKHWFVTELCPSSGRIHLHGVLFDVPLDIHPRSWIRAVNKRSGRGKYGAFLINDGEVVLVNKWLRKLWKYGNTWVDIARKESFGYMVKYMTKPCEIDPYYKPQLFVSPGLGKKYAETNAKYHQKPDGTTTAIFKYNGFSVALPRYLCKKIFTDEQRKQNTLQKFFNPSFSQSFRGKHYCNPDDYRDAIQQAVTATNESNLCNPKQTYPLTPPPDYLVYNASFVSEEYYEKTLQNIQFNLTKPFNYG